MARCGCGQPVEVIDRLSGEGFCLEHRDLAGDDYIVVGGDD